MLHLVDNTVKRVLEDGLGDSFPDLTITFATPDSDFPPPSVQLPAIDLFLYDVCENGERRNSQVRVESQDGKLVKVFPPRWVDCHYILTAWTGDEGDIAGQHRVLGDVMKVLLRYRRIPREYLEEELADQPFEMHAVGLHRETVQGSAGELWRALGTQPRATVHFTATIAVQAIPNQDAGDPVTQVDVRAHPAQL